LSRLNLALNSVDNKNERSSPDFMTVQDTFLYYWWYVPTGYDISIYTDYQIFYYRHYISIYFWLLTVQYQKELVVLLQKKALIILIR